jgi:hypothetical protein
MNMPVATEMLRLFQSGAATYQPEGLAFESGDPKVAAANLRRLLGSGSMIIDVLCRPTGTLFLFSTGQQYYAPGLRVGQDGLPTELLAEIVSEAGLGNLTELLDFYTAMPANFEGHLPDLRPGHGDGHDGHAGRNLQAAPESPPSPGSGA